MFHDNKMNAVILSREYLLRSMLCDNWPLPNEIPGTPGEADQPHLLSESADARPLLIDEQQARQLLGGLCSKTMYNLRQQGLPSVKVGSRVMYDPRDLSAWVQRNKASANAGTSDTSAD